MIDVRTKNKDLLNFTSSDGIAFSDEKKKDRQLISQITILAL